MTSFSASPIGANIVVLRHVELTADWADFSGELAKSVTEYFIKGWQDGIAGGVSALVKLLASVKIERSAGEKLWSLSIIAFTWSAKEIMSLEADDLSIQKSLKAAISKAQHFSRINDLTVSNVVLKRPTNLQLYLIMKSEFIRSLKELNSPSYRPDTEYRLDSAFNRGIFHIWSERPEFYSAIADILNAPAASAVEFEMSWEAYRAELIYDYEVRPIFGQEISKISLGQLYVPLRAAWLKAGVTASAEESSYFSPKHYEIAEIDQLLENWLDAEDSNDWLRLIGGGPGSGKSTTLRAMASRVSCRSDWRPLYIPLQHIELEADLREAIGKYFTETFGNPFNQSPLARSVIEDGPPLVLLFDGLDEIVAPGEGANEVVGTFANKLNNLVAALTGGSRRPIKVVVSGRMPAFQAARRYMTPKSGGSLEVHGFCPISDGSSFVADEIWTLDQRPLWWAKYAILTNQSVDVPEAFKNYKLSSITNEPLLCYLLTLAGYATEKWQLAADNRNRIYEALVNSIYDRGWGSGIVKRQGAGKTLNKEDFNKLMETIALAAWLGGDVRVASEDMFRSCIPMTAAQSAWDAFTDDNGSDVTNLAMNFYLKASEKSQRGFEFTHKSFGEYLASRAILSIADDILPQVPRRMHQALEEWSMATKSGHFDFEVFQFINDEVRLRISDKRELYPKSAIKNIKGTFESFAALVAEEGFPISRDVNSWKSLQTEQLNAECGLWVIINSCSKALSEVGDKEDSIVNIEWHIEDGWSHLLSRLGAYSQTSIIASCMTNIYAEKQSFADLRGEKYDFSGAVLNDATFVSCNFNESTFEMAVVDGLRFYLCRLRKTSFEDLISGKMIFHKSVITDCSFDETESSIVISPIGIITAESSHNLDLFSRQMVLDVEKFDLDAMIERFEARIAIMKNMKRFPMNNLVPDLTDRFVELEIGDIEDKY